ncbi:MAG: hypothetical protein ACOX74_02100 [Lachnospiraceae bacterium]|jgi:hypothetical protein
MKRNKADREQIRRFADLFFFAGAGRRKYFCAHFAAGGGWYCPVQSAADENKAEFLTYISFSAINMSILQKN